MNNLINLTNPHFANNFELISSYNNSPSKYLTSNKPPLSNFATSNKNNVDTTRYNNIESIKDEEEEEEVGGVNNGSIYKLDSVPSNFPFNHTKCFEVLKNEEKMEELNAANLNGPLGNDEKLNNKKKYVIEKRNANTNKPYLANTTNTVAKAIDNTTVATSSNSIVNIHNDAGNDVSSKSEIGESNLTNLKKQNLMCSLLALLSSHSSVQVASLLFCMSSCPTQCVALRRSGCIPLLILLLHNNEELQKINNNYNNNGEQEQFGSPPHSCLNIAPNSSFQALERHLTIRNKLSSVLRNIISVHCEDQKGKQEMRVLRLLEQVRDFCDRLRSHIHHRNFFTTPDPSLGGIDIFQDGSLEELGLRAEVQLPLSAINALMKLSFDDEHKHAMCTLGGIEALGELLELQQESFRDCLTPDLLDLRRFICMTLINVTFGDGSNKALFCSMEAPLKALVMQLQETNEELCQVASCVLRNLSWHADSSSKKNLQKSGAVGMLAKCMLRVEKEGTLKSLLSALWNFSSHSPDNKAQICATNGVLQLLVWCLSFKSSSKTLAIVENSGGVLRNISSLIASNPHYRFILRSQNCIPVLLKHLKSHSLTVVSNACGTLWNLSEYCQEDQRLLCRLGAIPMLKNLVHSKHKMISMGSSATLRNLISSSVFSDFSNPLTLSHSGLQLRHSKNLCSKLQHNVQLGSDLQTTFSPQNSFHEDLLKSINSISPIQNAGYIDMQRKKILSSRKFSINLTPLRPPEYPILLNDMVCKSQPDVLTDHPSKKLRNNSNHKNYHSLETESLLRLTPMNNDLNAGSMLEKDEDVSERQTMATEFYEVNSLERQIEIENHDFITSNNQTFCSDNALIYNNDRLKSKSSKLPSDKSNQLQWKNIKINKNNSDGLELESDIREGIEEDILCIKTDENGRFVDDSGFHQSKNDSKLDSDESKTQKSFTDTETFTSEKEKFFLSKIPGLSKSRKNSSERYTNESTAESKREIKPETFSANNNEPILTPPKNSKSNKNFFLSSDHEKVLVENANAVLSVLERISLAESNCSNNEVINLLEHETISLISGVAEDDDECFFMPSDPVSSLKKNPTNINEKQVELNETFEIEEQFLRHDENSEIENNDCDKMKETKYTFSTNTFDRNKPKIVKPVVATKPVDNAEKPKSIRGRRKALYPGVKSDKVEFKGIPPRTKTSNATNQKIKTPVNQKTPPKVKPRKESSPMNSEKANSKTTANQTKILPSKRPMSAFLKNVTSSNISEDKIKQAKLKSQSLPQGQKAPSKSDYVNILSKNPKNKASTKLDKTGPTKNKQSSKQEITPTYNDSELSSCKIKGGRVKSRLKSPKRTTPSASSSERLTSASSGSIRVAPNFCKSGSNYSVKSSKTPSISSKLSENAVKISAINKGKGGNGLANKQQNKYIAEEIRLQDLESNEDFIASKTRIPKSSTFDKINIIPDSSKENISFNDRRSNKNINKKGETQKKEIPKGPLKNTKDQLNQKDKPIKKAISSTSRLTNAPLLPKRSLPPPTSKPPKIPDSIPIKTKPSNIITNKNKQLDSPQKKDTTKEGSKENNNDDENKVNNHNLDSKGIFASKNKHLRGFSFWKKIPKNTMSKEVCDIHEGNETKKIGDNKKTIKIFNKKKLNVNTSKFYDQIDCEDIACQDIKKQNDKSPKDSKADSPIKKRVFGWFKKSHENQHFSGKKNKSTSEENNSNLVCNKSTNPAEQKNQPQSSNETKYMRSLSNDTKQQITALNTPNSRTSMAMSIDSLKVNSIDSLRITSIESLKINSVEAFPKHVGKCLQDL